MRPGYARTITNLHIVSEYPKNTYLNQVTQKLLAKLFLPKKSRNRKFQTPKKSFDHPYHLKSRVSLTGSSSTVYFLPNEQII